VLLAGAHASNAVAKGANVPRRAWRTRTARDRRVVVCLVGFRDHSRCAAARARDRSNSRGRLATILKRANATRAEEGLPPIAALTNHTLRRTFCSLMYEAGAQPTAVMAAMGHKSAKLALEVYAQKMERDRDTVTRMERLVWAHTGTRDEPVFDDVAAAGSGEERDPALGAG
jgi:integrase